MHTAFFALKSVLLLLHTHTKEAPTDRIGNKREKGGSFLCVQWPCICPCLKKRSRRLFAVTHGICLKWLSLSLSSAGSSFLSLSRKTPKRRYKCVCAALSSVARFSDLAQILVLFVGSRRFFFGLAISATAAIFRIFAVAQKISKKSRRNTKFGQFFEK